MDGHDASMPTPAPTERGRRKQALAFARRRCPPSDPEQAEAWDKTKEGIDAALRVGRHHIVGEACRRATDHAHPTFGRAASAVRSVTGRSIPGIWAFGRQRHSSIRRRRDAKPIRSSPDACPVSPSATDSTLPALGQWAKLAQPHDCASPSHKYTHSQFPRGLLPMWAILAIFASR